MTLARDVMTARRACKEGGAVGSNDGPVIGISGGIGVEVKPGVGLARREITGGSSAITAGAHADTIRTEIINRVKQKGSRKLRSIFNLLSSAVDRLF